jgi:hypothetical protein
MATIVIKYTVDGVDEIIQTYDEVEAVPDIEDVSAGFIDIVGEQPTREERRS